MSLQLVQSQGPQAQKDATLGLMLCCYTLEVLHSFRQEPCTCIMHRVPQVTQSVLLGPRSFPDMRHSVLIPGLPQANWDGWSPYIACSGEKESESPLRGIWCVDSQAPGCPKRMPACRGFAEPSSPDAAHSQAQGVGSETQAGHFQRDHSQQSRRGLGPPGEAAGCHLAHG